MYDYFSLVTRKSDSLRTLWHTDSILKIILRVDLWILRLYFAYFLISFFFFFPGNLGSNWLAHISAFCIHTLRISTKLVPSVLHNILPATFPCHNTCILLEVVWLQSSTKYKEACQVRVELKLMPPHLSFSFCSISHSAVRIISLEYQAGSFIDFHFPTTENECNPSFPRPSWLSHALISNLAFASLVELEHCLTEL